MNLIPSRRVELDLDDAVYQQSLALEKPIASADQEKQKFFNLGIKI